MRQFLRLFGVICVAAANFAGPWALGDDKIEGIQPAALDQPRIILTLKRTATGPALEPKDKDAGDTLEAFLDTGASGVVLSTETAESLGIRAEKTARGEDVIFEDVGVGGTEKFGVAEQLYFSLNSGHNGDEVLNNPLPIRAQIRPEGGILQIIAPAMDVAGTPLIAGNVIVIDPKPLAKFDKLRTSVFTARDKRIPKTSIHVPLTGVSFAAFTRTEPPEAPRPDCYPNPMIGPSPFKNGDTRKPVVIRHKGKTATGTFLLDTGAATSMISSKLARQLGINVDENGGLAGAANGSFSLPVGGIGGMKISHGTFFDELELPTRESRPLVFAKAPLLVADITVVRLDGQQFTLDGVLGMNYLVASAEIAGGMLPQVGEIVDGPFKIIVIDLDRGELGLEMK